MSTAALKTPTVTLHVEDGTDDSKQHWQRQIQYTAPCHEQKLNIGGGLMLRAVLSDSDDLYVGPEGDFNWHTYGDMIADDDLIAVEVLGEASTREVTRTYEWWDENARGGWSLHRGRHQTRSAKQDDCYVPGEKGRRHDRKDYQFKPDDPRRLPYAYVEVKITAFGQTVQRTLRFPLPTTGEITLGNMQHGKPVLNIAVNALGVTASHRENFEAESSRYYGSRYYGDNVGPLEVLTRHLAHSTIEGGPDALWTAFLGRWGSKPPMAGIASIYKRKAIKPTLERLEADEPVDWAYFRWLHDVQTLNGRKNNQLLAAFLKAVGDDYDATLAALRTARETTSERTLRWQEYGGGKQKDFGFPARRAAVLTLPGVAERVREQDSKRNFRLRKTTAGQADGLGVTEDNYPKLFAAIRDSHIPIGVFNQPGKDGQPVNREFALWERALSQKGWAEVIYEVAQNASRRGTYERDITPWLNALFMWPAFLDRNTKGRKKWKGMPKFVQSQWELEMGDDDGDAEGPQKTRKERSAFTPQVDNENRILHIPYVAVCVSGVRTQWCYARNYYLFQAGFTDPETGGIVVNDLERNLNGVGDDYGLCYFTLTGTTTARGYPTFLIIFERRSNGTTWVHFHRVRPCRSAKGVKTPAVELVERCYQYMAGNIPAEDITAQQGDLIFIKHGNDPIAAKAKVHPDAQTGCTFEFESHRFVSDNDEVPLTLHRSAAKTPKNRLGFMHAPSGISVRHPEHDDIVGLEEGWYEIRRCKSYENNPVGIWSLTID